MTTTDQTDMQALVAAYERLEHAYARVGRHFTMSLDGGPVAEIDLKCAEKEAREALALQDAVDALRQRCFPREPATA